MAQDIDFGDPIQFGGAKPQTVGSAIQNGGARPLFSQMHTVPTQQSSAQQVSLAQASVSQSPQVVAHNPSAITPLPRFALKAPGEVVMPGSVKPVVAAQPGIAPMSGMGQQVQAQTPRSFLQPESNQPLPSPDDSGSGGARKFMFGIIALIGIGILFGIGYFVYLRFTGNDSANNTVQNTSLNSLNNSTPSGADANKDPDNDGLLNYEEEQYGTDPDKADTDGDGFKDGAEVEKGFNPKGDGKLPTPGRF